MTEVLLEVENLTKTYGRNRAVDGAGFSLPAGASLGVIGPNGSGKTTLVNLITGFTRPSEGKVVFEGRDITGLAPHKIAARGLARTFQMPRPFGRLSAADNLLAPLVSPRVARLPGGRWGGRQGVALDILEEVGFERDSGIHHKPAGALPHGHLKRLELARCLALRPRLIILDEIFSGLSHAETAGLLPVIERLRREGVTLIMVEHRLRELFRVVDRVLVLDYGRVIAEGDPAEVMADPEVREAYLGVVQD